jgi:SAM-dependent methyltransferase
MENEQNGRTTLRNLYATGKQVRRSFKHDDHRAEAYYNDYITFVRRCMGPGLVEPRRRLLDVGCGVGWSSFIFAWAGYQVTGIDLNASAFEPPAHENLTLVEGTVLELPFSDASYDVVTAYSALEHIPDPGAAMREMVRVCRPGGIICIVGPNLLSPYQSLKFLALNLKNGVFRRRPGMARHPFGNTVPESLKSFPINMGRTFSKLLSPPKKANFIMRIPDTIPPFHGDNDACYLCNPMDVCADLKRNGCRIEQNGAYGRARVLAPFVGGTWVAAQKAKA